MTNAFNGSFSAFAQHSRSAAHVVPDAQRSAMWQKATGHVKNPVDKQCLEILLGNAALAVARSPLIDLYRPGMTGEQAYEALEAASVTSTVIGTILPAYLYATQRMWDQSILPQIMDVQPMPNGGLVGKAYVLGGAMVSDISSMYAADTDLRRAISIDVVRPSEGGTASQIRTSVTETTLTAVEHKLFHEYSHRLGIGFAAQFAMRLGDLTLRLMIDYLTAIKNFAVLDDLDTALAGLSADHVGSWNSTTAGTTYETQVSRYQTLLHKLIDVDKAISRDWGVSANTIVSDSTGISWLRKAGTEKARPDLEVDPSYKRAQAAGTLNRYGSNFVGIFKDQYRVFQIFKTPSLGSLYMASKGPNFETGGVYGPSVELDVSPEFIQPSTFTHAQGIISICDWKFPVASCYGRLDIV